MMVFRFSKDVTWTQEWKDIVLEAIAHRREYPKPDIKDCACCIKARMKEFVEPGDGMCRFCPLHNDSNNFTNWCNYYYFHQSIRTLNNMERATREREVK